MLSFQGEVVQTLAKVNYVICSCSLVLTASKTSEPLLTSCESFSSIRLLINIVAYLISNCSALLERYIRSFFVSLYLEFTKYLSKILSFYPPV